MTILMQIASRFIVESSENEDLEDLGYYKELLAYG